MLRLFLILIICHLSLLTSVAQRPRYEKMSPLLRQLVQESRRDGRVMHRGAGSQKPQLVCAFVKATDPKAFSDYDCKVLAQVGQVYIASIPIGELTALSLDSRVLRMEARQGNSLTNDWMPSILNALPAYSGENLPQAYTGRGVVVGLMDIGFDLTHPTFYSNDTTEYRIRQFWDMLSTDTVGSPFYVGRDYVGREALLEVAHSRDGLDQSHGTHTAGIAAGSGYGSPYRGMAPEADLCLVSNAVSDDIIYIDSADYYKYTFATDALGFKYMFDYAKSQDKPCVLSFSEGSMQDFWGYDQLYYEMLDSLMGPGRILVSSAGNNGHKKTWFRKPAGVHSAGAFINASSQQAMLTFKSADDFTLRFVLYGETNDTLLVPSAQVLAQPDSSLFVHAGEADSLHYTFHFSLQTEAYPSCYNPSEVCYDVTVLTTNNVGVTNPLSVEVIGVEADVEYFKVNANLLTNRLNPALNAGEKVCNINSPSSAPRVISVGATTYRDSIQNKNGVWMKYWTGEAGKRVDFSSVGPTFDGRVKPDVMAPGNNVISAYSSYYREAHPESGDLRWDVAVFPFGERTYSWTSNSGTSMSCPAVAGAIALWLQAKPDLTPEEVMGVISRTSRRLESSLTYPNNYYGYGELDVYRGLLDILGVDRIETVSTQHTPARITLSGDVLTITPSEPLTSDARLRLFTVGGRLQRDVRLLAGESGYRLSLSTLPSGIYVVQLDGPSAVKGSTLIRK